MSKKLHVDCFLVGNTQVEEFRKLVRAYNEPVAEEYKASEVAAHEPLVEIRYEEIGRDTTGFDLWFGTPATGFRFGLQWGERRLELAQQSELAAYRVLVAAQLRKLMLQAIYPSFDTKHHRKEGYVAAEQYIDELAAALGVSTGPPAAPAYPQFLYYPKLRYWLRYNSPEYFCLVSESQLQVRRERPQELFKPDEIMAVTQAAFMEQYQRISQLMRERAQNHMAVFQHRGSEGNQWFYCNFIYAGSSKNALELHLRLNVSVDEHGRSWQLLYAHDTRPNDSRRAYIQRADFEQQLDLLLGELEAAATGQEGGQPNG